MSPIHPQELNESKYETNVWGIWFMGLSNLFEPSQLSPFDEDLPLKHPEVWSSLWNLIFDHTIENFNTPSSDLKTILVVNFCTKLGVANFYEFKLIADKPNTPLGHWWIRKEYRELKTHDDGCFDTLLYHPIVMSSMKNSTNFSLNIFSKYLDKYQIVWASKSRSRSRFNKPRFINKNKSEGRLSKKQYPSITVSEQLGQNSRYVVDSVTCKNDRNSQIKLIDLKKQISNDGGTINTPHFASKENFNEILSMRNLSGHPSAQFTTFEEQRGKCLDNEDKENQFLFANFGAPRELYINKAHNRILQEWNNRYEQRVESDAEDSFSQSHELPRQPLQEIKRIEEDLEDDVYQFDMREAKPLETPVEYNLDKTSQEQLNKQPSNETIQDPKVKVQNPIKFINKVFESDKEFQAQLIGLNSFERSKADPGDEEINPYSNFDLTGTLLMDQNEEVNMLSFSSKAMTKFDLRNLTKGEGFNNFTQDKLSTIKSTSELGVTSKIDKCQASPNTRKIMQIQNIRIKSLQEKVIQLVKEKEKQRNESHQNVDLTKFVNREELIDLLAKLIPDISKKKLESCEKQTVSRADNKLDRNNKLKHKEYNLYSNNKKLQRSVSSDAFKTQNPQSKAEVFTNSSNIKCSFASERTGNQIKYDNFMKRQKVYKNNPDTNQSKDWIKILSSNLSKIDETAKYEDETSPSNSRGFNTESRRNQQYKFNPLNSRHGSQSSNLVYVDVSSILSANESL